MMPGNGSNVRKLPVYAQLFPQGPANLPLPGTMVPMSPGKARAKKMQDEYHAALQKARDNNKYPFDLTSLSLEEALRV